MLRQVAFLLYANLQEGCQKVSKGPDDAKCVFCLLLGGEKRDTDTNIVLVETGKQTLLRLSSCTVPGT